ncbi:initiation-specific alpha-1,6-mannosyltransferase [Seiridium cupressi]
MNLMQPIPRQSSCLSTQRFSRRCDADCFAWQTTTTTSARAKAFSFVPGSCTDEITRLPFDQVELTAFHFNVKSLPAPTAHVSRIFHKPDAMSRRILYALYGSIGINVILLGKLGGYFDITSHAKPAPLPIPVQPVAIEEFPRKIWQSWKDDSENPTERTTGFPKKWRELNPDYRYERITDANINEYVRGRYDGDIPEVFTKATDPILKADYLRYLVLLEEGGVWADIDVLPHQPISKWVPEEHHDRVNLVVGIENDHSGKPIWPGSPYSVQLSQYTVLAKPHHPAIANLVGSVNKNLKALLESKASTSNHMVSFEEVMTNTGPFAFTDALMTYFGSVTGREHNGNEFTALKEPVLIGNVLVLPRVSFGWLGSDAPAKEGDVLVQHLFIGSWRAGHPG